MRSPLPLVPFESYMLADDRASHPMTFTIRLKFRGQIDQEAFRQSVFEALERHPLLSARIVKRRFGRLAWDWSLSPEPYVDIADAQAPLRYPGGEAIDLRHGCGVRIWVRQGAERCEMRLQFHHACSDGIGAYRFIEDLLCAYHNRMVNADQRVNLRPLNATLLHNRARFGMGRLGMLARLPLELWGLVIGFATFFLRRPVKVYRPHRFQPVDPGAVVDQPAQVLSDEELANLKRTSRREGATLNDVLTRDLCLAIEQWNAKYGAAQRFKPIRVMVPVNLRTRGDDAMPAANVVAMVFVDRKPAWYASSQWLLKTIAWELGLIKRFRLALAFVRGTALVRLIPGGLKFLTRANRCYATCVFSNMGKVLNDTPLPYLDEKLSAGDLTLEAVESASPVRPHTSVAFSCVTYGGRTRLVLNYERYALSASAAAALFRTILAQVGVGASSPEPATPVLVPTAA